MAIGARREARAEVDGSGAATVDARAIDSRVARVGRGDGCVTLTGVNPHDNVLAGV